MTPVDTPYTFSAPMAFICPTSAPKTCLFLPSAARTCKSCSRDAHGKRPITAQQQKDKIKRQDCLLSPSTCSWAHEVPQGCTAAVCQEEHGDRLVQLGWSDGNWRDHRNELQFFSRGYFGGDTAMVWSGFCPNGGLGVTFILTRVNSCDYSGVFTLVLPKPAQWNSARFPAEQRGDPRRSFEDGIVCGQQCDCDGFSYLSGLLL
ncbi:hypothetical protein Y032_0045g1148 [Ancylostoma ceylanicum]|uniref:Uncharacterized protein n=1 Tax=Ancylostoma ceylanicum TaxID=53326 RepID=A0A016UDG7_9BILA|nr:hypothetical protein Y032_0045g1148 [Ancylostoma ceylanicum]